MSATKINLEPAPINGASSHLPTRALSLYSPWIFAILRLGKRIENRNWTLKRSTYPAIRGPFWIHASKFGHEKGVGRESLEAEIRAMVATAQQADAGSFAVPSAQTLLAMRGHIVARSEVLDVVTESDSPWFFGPLGLVLAPPVELARPVLARGALGLWPVPEPVLAQLQDASPEADSQRSG